MTESTARRWRLILGRYAEQNLPTLDADVGLDRTLSYLYDREYAARGHRQAKGGGGSLDPSALKAVDWLGDARRLFPSSTLERMEHDAIARYGLDDLLRDPQAVASLSATPQLASSLLRLRSKLRPETASGLRTLIRTVVDDVVARLRPQFTSSFFGQRSHQRTPHASPRNLDWRSTINANLANVDPATGVMLVEQVRFVSRQRRRNLNWQVIIVVDQSGSMAESVLHSAVTAAILAALPGITVRLVLFDTGIADLSDLVTDPVEVLMTAQLGGGTDIAKALGYAERLVAQPSRTVLTLISDFEEGGSVTQLIATTKRLAQSGVTLLGLASLGEGGEPSYDRAVAARLAEAGMEIGAMTPDRLAEWLAEVTR